MGASRTYAKPSQDREPTAIAAEPPVAAGERAAGGPYDPAALRHLVASGQSVSPAQRTGAFHDAQQYYGNRAVQRLMAKLPVIQRACVCGGACSTCKEDEERRRAGVQRQAAGSVGTVDGTVQEIARHGGGGQPLESATRTSMESRFGQDFSAVRVHTDSQAHEWAQRLNAHAFTSGGDIFFAAGKYAPHTAAGQRLLAHELTHVAQQRHATAVQRLTVGSAASVYEREADAAAAAVLQGQRVTITAAPPGAVPTVARSNGSTALAPTGRRSGRDLRHCIVGDIRVPSGVLEPQYVAFGARAFFQRSFNMAVDFLDDPNQGCVSRELEFRQYVNDDYRFVVGGRRLPHQFPNYPESTTPAGWFVDGESSHVYGVRIGQGNQPGDSYLPRRVDGPQYRGSDSPGFSSVQIPHAPLELRLQFMAQVIHTDPTSGAKTVVRRSSRWVVDGVYPRPGPVRRALRRLRWLMVFSPRSLSVELPENLKPGATVRLPIPRAVASTTIPGLDFRRVALTIGPDMRPVKGELTARPTLPFLRDRTRDLTLAVSSEGENGHVALDFRLPMRLGALGETELHMQSREGRLQARSTFTPAPRFLQNARAEILYEDGQFSGGLAFTPEAFKLPIPGLAVENARGGLTFGREGITGEGGATLKYRGLGQADITARYDRKGLGVEGLLTVNIPGLQPVTGAISYRRGQLAAEVRLAKEHFPAGLPLERGSITIRLVDGQVEGSGHLGVRLGPVGRGDLTFAYQNGNVELGAGIQLKIPGLRGGIVTLRYREGQLEGEGQIPLNPDRLPGLGGNLRVWYREGRFGGETRFGYRRGELAGSVTVILQQLEDGSLAISGGGDVSARITPWLVGTVHVDITPEAEVNVQGEIRAPKEVPLFRRKPLEKMKTFPRIEIPLFGFSIPVVGHVGLVAFIEGGGGFTAFVGPAVLRNITVAGAFSTQEEQSPAFDISGEFYLPAGAEAFLFIRGGISLGALVAEIEGAITLQGGLGAVGSLSVIPHIGYANGDYYFRGNWQLQALAYLRLSGKAEAAIRVGVWRLKKTVWDDEWPLFNWVFPLGLNVGLKGRMEYTFGRPFEPSFEFQADELDPMSIAKAAVPGPGKSPSSGPAAPPAPQGEMQTEDVPGVRAATAEARPTAGTKPAAVATPATPRPSVRAAAAPRAVRPTVSAPAARAMQAPPPVRAAMPAPVGGAPGAGPRPIAPPAPPRRPGPAATAPVSPAAVSDQAPPVTESAPRIDIAFEEAGERHHIWVDFVNGRPRLMVASTPMNINDFLDHLQQVVIPGLPEPERPPLLARVRQLGMLALMIADPRARGSVPLNEQMNLMIPEIRALFRIIARRYQALGIPDPLGEAVRIMTLPMRNIAIARYEINGQSETLFTLSGETEIAGTTPQRGVFAARRIQTRFGGAGPRHHDNEIEVLNYVANRFAQVTVADGVPEASLRPRPEVRGRLYISSDFITCASCAFVIGRFRRLFPNVILVSTSLRPPRPPIPN